MYFGNIRVAKSFYIYNPFILHLNYCYQINLESFGEDVVLRGFLLREINMSNLVTLHYNDVSVIFQSEDVYINATLIAKQFGKLTKDYLKSSRTKEYIAAVRTILLTEENQLVRVIQGGASNEQGTWLHPKLAIDFARWLSPEFAVWCDTQIDKLMKKEIKPMSQIEALLQSVQLMVEIEHRQKETESNVIELQEKVKELEYKTHTSPNEFYTVSGYSSLRGIKVDVSVAGSLGKKATKLSKEWDYPINKAHSEIFGQVNVYHIDVLNSMFETL